MHRKKIIRTTLAVIITIFTMVIPVPQLINVDVGHIEINLQM